MFRPTIPGKYIVPSIALDNLELFSNCSICSKVKVGFKTYLISSRDESKKFKQTLSSQVLNKYKCPYQWFRNYLANSKTSTYVNSGKRDDFPLQNEYTRGCLYPCLENTFHKPNTHKRLSWSKKLNTIFRSQNLSIGGWLCQDRDINDV